MASVPTPEEWSQLNLLLTRARAGDDTVRDELFARSRPFLVRAAEQEVASWLRPKQDRRIVPQEEMEGSVASPWQRTTL